MYLLTKSVNSNIRCTFQYLILQTFMFTKVPFEVDIVIFMFTEVLDIFSNTACTVPIDQNHNWNA